MIKVTNLKKRFGDLVVLNGIDFVVKVGEVL
jgi:ABC-type polar amino acid transport system ATPase subunit